MTDTPTDNAHAAHENIDKAALAKSRAVAASLGALVSVFMRAPDYKDMTLANLELLVGPAISTDQFAIAEARDAKSGIIAPIAVLLWAMVSPEIDKRLLDTSEPNPRLEPKDWRSGDIPWIIVATGEKRALASLLERVVGRRFADTPPKMRLKAPDGSTKIGQIGKHENRQTPPANS